MIYSYCIEGLPVQTGDILCTTSGGEDIAPGEFWRLLGRLVPGAVDHIALYVGPGARCVESVGLGVVLFDLPGERWVATQMWAQRGRLVDRLYGVAYPLADKGLSLAEETRIREAVAAYCVAQVGKPYNLNYLDPETEASFYCSQLIYKAYLLQGIDLNTGLGVPNLLGTDRIIFPQEVWQGCVRRRVEES